MAPASNKLKLSQPVLPLDLIRKIVRMCVELRTQISKDHCLEGHRLWLVFGGKLVLEDIRNIKLTGARRTKNSLICLLQLTLWEKEYNGEPLRKDHASDIKEFRTVVDYMAHYLIAATLDMDISHAGETEDSIVHKWAMFKTDWVDRYNSYIDYSQYAVTRIVDDIMCRNDYSNAFDSDQAYIE
jgi:hypothetical protein